MRREHVPGNIYWDDHGSGYHLCVVDGRGKQTVISYPYYCLTRVNNVAFLGLDERCEISDRSSDLHPLEQQCCVQLLGKVGADLSFTGLSGTLLSGENVRVAVPNQFQMGFQ